MPADTQGSRVSFRVKELALVIGEHSPEPINLLAVHIETKLRKVAFKIGLYEIAAPLQAFLAIIANIARWEAALKPQPI